MCPFFRDFAFRKFCRFQLIVLFHQKGVDTKIDTVGMWETLMGRGGIEPPTHGFSVRCSTD